MGKNKDQKRWAEVLNIDYMSSEASDGNENEPTVCHIYSYIYIYIYMHVNCQLVLHVHA